MKTAVTVLQEMMIKIGELPDYECVAQSGPQHQALFEYRCTAMGATVTGTARSKKEAKQEAARLMLLELSARGHSVPASFAAPVASEAGGSDAAAAAANAPRNFVALLTELCVECGLPAPAYELVGDTGPPHLRHFTVSASVGALQRLATATTKKAARQLAYEQLYTYLRENLTRHTADFVEEEALVRAHERVMERYCEVRDDRRIDLGMKMADYHLSFASHASAEARLEAYHALDPAVNPDAGDCVLAALTALGVPVEAFVADGTPPVHMIKAQSAPPVVWAGLAPAEAAESARHYVRRALRPPAATTNS